MAASADGPKHAMPAATNGIRHARDQRRLRPDDDEVDTGIQGQRHHGVGVGDPTGQGHTERKVRDAGVPRAQRSTSSTDGSRH
jgi:hypothetical protein